MKISDLFGVGSKPRVRMAPSPTGNLHIGTARATLYNYLFAKHTGGTFVLRIEDTDRERSKPEFEKNILNGLEWLGIEWDEFYRQSERTEIYTKALSKLIDSDKAYVSKEPSKDDPSKEVELVRLRNPGGVIAFQDMIRGEISVDVSDLGDFVIARSITDPLYHLAVVVDDGEMGITHVIRSDDHISNTPRQILILEALGYTRPIYAHQPLVLAPDRSKLSKRHGATSLDEYKAMGFIPEAIVNYLAFLGWNPGGEKEVFTLEELIEVFDLEKLHAGGAIFDINRFLWYNREHIKRLSLKEFATRLSEFGVTADDRLLPLLHDRVSTLKEAADLLAGEEFSFLTSTPVLSNETLLPTVKGERASVESTKKHLQAVLEMLTAVDTSQWAEESVKNAVWAYAEKEGKGLVLWPMRVALTGKEKSPDPFTVASLLGKEETITRLNSALSFL